MGSYATLAQCRDEIAAESDDTRFDNEVVDYLNFVTARLDDFFYYWRFEPVIATRRFDWLGVDKRTQTLELDAPLLEASEILNGDGTALTLWDYDPDTRADADVIGYPTNDSPIKSLSMLNGLTWNNTGGDRGQGVIQITGKWGFRNRYTGEGWRSSLDANVGALSSGATSFNVTDADGADITGRVPRFSRGQLIKIGSEFFNVTGVNTTTNLVSVEPGANGSTPAAHLAGQTIYTWYPQPSIVRATLRWAAYLHSRRANFESLRFDGLGGTVKFPSDMPEEVVGILAALPKYREFVGV